MCWVSRSSSGERLDVRARAINDEMKIAASQALAALAKEPVPAEVLKAYNMQSAEFGKDYILPKPLDRRVCLWLAPAVAQAAMQSGVARCGLTVEEHRHMLAERLKIH